ncbi:MAG TPA: peptide deformylase [Chthoniobacteraceae bacterium]|nr:peptide deformylase [Chthoniobacteraceae bacterium]
MILDIAKYPDPVLRAKGKKITKITDEIRDLAANMIETMNDAHGVGLAAQQVSVPVQLTVLDVTKSEDRPSTMSIDGKLVELSEWMPMALLNPELVLGKERESGNEGCLSFPEISGEIDRAASVTATGQLLDGRKVTFHATGLLARALQHEVDHLNGILFVDRMNSAGKLSVANKLKRMQREAK